MSTLIDRLIRAETRELCPECDARGLPFVGCPSCDPHRLRWAEYQEHPGGQQALLVILASLELTCRSCNGTGTREIRYTGQIYRDFADGEPCTCNNGKRLTDTGRALLDFLKRWQE